MFFSSKKPLCLKPTTRVEIQPVVNKTASYKDRLFIFTCTTEWDAYLHARCWTKRLRNSVWILLIKAFMPTHSLHRLEASTKRYSIHNKLGLVLWELNSPEFETYRLPNCEPRIFLPPFPTRH